MDNVGQVNRTKGGKSFIFEKIFLVLGLVMTRFLLKCAMFRICRYFCMIFAQGKMAYLYTKSENYCFVRALTSNKFQEGFSYKFCFSCFSITSNILAQNSSGTISRSYAICYFGVQRNVMRVRQLVQI